MQTCLNSCTDTMQCNDFEHSIEFTHNRFKFDAKILLRCSAHFYDFFLSSESMLSLFCLIYFFFFSNKKKSILFFFHSEFVRGINVGRDGALAKLFLSYFFCTCNMKMRARKIVLPLAMNDACVKKSA